MHESYKKEIVALKSKFNVQKEEASLLKKMTIDTYQIERVHTLEQSLRSNSVKAIRIPSQGSNAGLLSNSQFEKQITSQEEEKQESKFEFAIDSQRLSERSVPHQYKSLTIETDNLEDTEGSNLTGKSTYKEERQLTIEEYLDRHKGNIIHFKAMVKHFGVNETMVMLPKKLAKHKKEVTTPDAHVQSIGATHEDKVMFIRFITDQFKLK